MTSVEELHKLQKETAQRLEVVNQRIALIDDFLKAIPEIEKLQPLRVRSIASKKKLRSALEKEADDLQETQAKITKAIEELEGDQA